MFTARSSGARLTDGMAGSGSRIAVSFAMKTPLVIALAMAVVLGTGSALAAMNYACKSSHHSWCADQRRLIYVHGSDRPHHCERRCRDEEHPRESKKSRVDEEDRERDSSGESVNAVIEAWV